MNGCRMSTFDNRDPRDLGTFRVSTFLNRDPGTHEPFAFQLLSTGRPFSTLTFLSMGARRSAAASVPLQDLSGLRFFQEAMSLITWSPTIAFLPVLDLPWPPPGRGPSPGLIASPGASWALFWPDLGVLREIRGRRRVPFLWRGQIPGMSPADQQLRQHFCQGGPSPSQPGEFT
jgi:hypothetical protein